MTSLDVLPALAGGLLIGLSATLLLWFSGRVAGISGILFGVFTRARDERNWRLLFLAGLVIGGGIYTAFIGEAAAQRDSFPLWKLITAGLLVGMGTRLGSGCTSGHGVCGISRLSTRSLLATTTFLAVGMIVATLSQLLGIA